MRSAEKFSAQSQSWWPTAIKHTYYSIYSFCNSTHLAHRFSKLFRNFPFWLGQLIVSTSKCFFIIRLSTYLSIYLSIYQHMHIHNKRQNYQDLKESDDPHIHSKHEHRKTLPRTITKPLWVKNQYSTGSPTFQFLKFYPVHNLHNY